MSPDLRIDWIQHVPDRIKQLLKMNELISLTLINNPVPFEALPHAK